MNLWFATYLVGAILVGGFFLGAQMTRTDTSNKETGFALVLALIWPMTIAGLAWAAVFKWAERQGK